MSSVATNSAHDNPPGTIKWICILLPFAYLWFRLIDNLRLEWMTNPQYGYGLLVPLLCIGLLIRRWHTLTDDKAQWSVVSGQWSVVLLCILAFFYLPTRLIEAATPEWRPIQWSLGVIAIGLTLCAIYVRKGGGWLRQTAFPICFFFVAIPWPMLVETPIIQTLTRASAAIAVELLGWVGVPAMDHGNVIEVSTGMVGIDEACSGIRSIQSSVMISLFLGEFYRLSRLRRWLLIPTGLVFSITFNICRMSLLTFVAAKKGMAAISQLHDPAGIAVTVLCTVGLWGLALLFRGRVSGPTPVLAGERCDAPSRLEDGTQRTHFPIRNFRFPTLYRFGLCLLMWLVVVEASVEVWYRSRESHLKPGPVWSLNFPQDNPTLKYVPIDTDTRNLLRFDAGKHAAWRESDGTQWEAFCFSWLPGRVAGYLAKRHTPEVCFGATGRKLLSGPELTMFNVDGVELPIRSYVFQIGDSIIQVFHCRWEAGAGSDAYVAHESARYNLVRSIWAGRGNKGQRVLEFVVWGMDDPAQAKQAFARHLEKMIKIEKPAPGS